MLKVVRPDEWHNEKGEKHPEEEGVVPGHCGRARERVRERLGPEEAPSSFAIGISLKISYC